MALDVRKCKECGKIFPNYGRDKCPECLKKLDDWFVAIRDYLDEHPHAKVVELSEELEIPEKVILNFIKEGRILVREAIIKCLQCGKPVYSGSICDECKKNIGSQINKAVEAKKKIMERFDTGVEINRTGGMHSKK